MIIILLIWYQSTPQVLNSSMNRCRPRLVCGYLGQQRLSYLGLMNRAPLTHTAQADICRFSGFDKLLLKVAKFW